MPHADPMPTPPAPTEPETFDEVDQTLRRLTPWAVSLLLHVGIVVVAMILVWTTLDPTQPERAPVQMQLSDTPAPAASASQMTQAEAVDESSPTTPTMDSLNPRAPKIDQVNLDLTVPNLDLTVMPDQIAPNPRGNDRSKGPGDGEILPPVQANRIVYVIDASGSLIDSFPFIINELRDAIDQMGKARTATARPYEFAVVFFRDGQVVELGGPGTGLNRGFNPATPDRVTHAIAWLSAGGANIGPGGKTDPMPAILQALRYKPEQLVLLSDNITGHGIHALDPDALIDDVLDARGNQRIRFDTVQFLYADPMVELGRVGTLDRLARETGGTHRFVSERQLGLR